MSNTCANVHRATADYKHTVAPIAAAPVAALQPEFLRFPRPGQVEPISGLRRSQLYELVKEGLIRSVSLRRPGKIRGTRLIVADSLRAYLRGLTEEQCGTPAHANADIGRVGEGSPISRRPLMAPVPSVESL